MISMSQHIHNLMGESMKGLRDLVDVDCIVGKPIVTASNTTIIPISKVTFGFGSGGSSTKIILCRFCDIAAARAKTKSYF